MSWIMNLIFGAAVIGSGIREANDNRWLKRKYMKRTELNIITIADVELMNSQLEEKLGLIAITLSM